MSGTGVMETLRDETASGLSFPRRSILLAAMLTLALIAAGVWAVYSTYQTVAQNSARYVKYASLRGEILLLDEVLSMSARMAAATGDPEWEARYRRFEPELEDALMAAVALSEDPGIAAAAVETNAANMALVEQENQAFALVREGRADKARALLSSETYGADKRAYAEGMAKFLDRLNEVAESLLRMERNKVAAAIVGAILGAVVLVLTWLAVIGSMNKWRAAIVRAFTERTRTEERLTATTARLEHLLHAGPAMIYSFKASGDHAATFVSDNVREQLGYQPEDFLGDPNFWAGHIHPDDAPRVMDQLAKVFESGHHIQEYRFLRADGSYRWMHDELGLILGPDGKPQEIIGYWVDSTERKQAEETLREYALKLERSNRELQDFAYVASHDLQEPLRKIEAFSDRLKVKFGDALPEDAQDYLNRMQGAAGRMRALINDLLSYSRVTTKAQPPEPVALSEIAREVVSDLHTRIEESGGRVEVGDLPMIEADRTQMRQLLQNLIGNALKFRRPGEPPVVKVDGRIEERPAAGQSGQYANGARCMITVADNGIGFDEKYLLRIFNIFQRLHGRNEYEGTGIGLATCRKIAERHGGSITAKGIPGEGATFIVTLPPKQPNKESLDETSWETDHDPDGRR